MKKKNSKHTDPFLRRIQDYRALPGLSPIEVALRSGGPHIDIGFEVDGPDFQYSTFHRDPDEILCMNSCLGIGSDAIVRHLQPGLLGAVGLCAGNEGVDRVRAKVRCRAFLSVPDATDRDRGKEVYAAGPSGPFSVRQTEGAYRIGFLRFKEPGTNRCSVSVVAYNDEGPRDLAVSNSY